ncbi:MAG: ChbG/HpnK family deacetylase [Gammaproteobacteria bacterium]|nr:ChbG/HpnK family deacetylase [Gammaproteobacteria bacterium]
MTIKNLSICADDFAQNESISTGILQLASLGRLNAISCLVNGGSWRELAATLKSLPNHVAIGLHLNLTLGDALSLHWKARYGRTFPSLSHLFKLVYLGKLCPKSILSEFESQWAKFVEYTGRTPDFIDGHQHIHQYGVIRAVCIRLFERHAFKGICRVSSNGLNDLYSLRGFPKPAAMYMLGGARLRRALLRHEIKTNTSFEGFYPFKQAANYRHYFRQFLAHSQPGGIIMCHPGHASSDETDPLYPSRGAEYAYLMSDDYGHDLKEFGFGQATE